MAQSTEEFYRIQKLPPYVFAVINEMRARARARVCRDQRNAGAGARRATGRDRSGYGQSRWRHAARGGRQDGGSRPQCAQPPLFGFARHPSAARGNHPAVPDELRRGTRSRDGSDCHHRRQGRPGTFALCGGRTGRCGGLAESGIPHSSIRRDHGRRGDAVVSPNPAYPIHQYGVIMAEGHACLLPMPSPAEFLNRLEDLYRTSTRQPKLMLISFPHNPTTTCVDLDFFREIVGMASRYGTLVVHDFAYADLGFDGYKPPSILQVEGAKEVAVEIFSMSKSYNMAGWRVGYCLGNPRMIGALARIKSYLDYGVFQPIQIASIIALRECEEDTRLPLGSVARTTRADCRREYLPGPNVGRDAPGVVPAARGIRRYPAGEGRGGRPGFAIRDRRS